MIKYEDLEKFKGQYPYGSELFGVYQTLLGWRGARAKGWFMRPYARERGELGRAAYDMIRPDMDAMLNADRVLDKIGEIRIGKPNADPVYQSKLVETLAPHLTQGTHLDDPDYWKHHLTDDMLMATLNREVKKEAKRMVESPDAMGGRETHISARSQAALDFLAKESSMAGQLKLLRDTGGAGELKNIFFNHSTAAVRVNAAIKLFKAFDPFAYFDPGEILSRTVVSPIGVIHLYRQYFFELDSFLGSPVGHVWVAPHTTVELVEVNKRRTLTESIIDESAFARVEQFDESFTLENLHEAVTQSNQQDLSFGASVSGSHSWIVGSVQASSSMNYHQTQSESRNAVHDLMRRQTQRISSLMEKSVHTTFKTVTEKEEISSKKYVVSNPGDDVINYELRRKMRRVAVQVQDVGTYLSWQTFVDDPAREIGVANLVHIAEPPNLGNIPHPQMIEPKPSKTTTESVMIPFQPEGHAGTDAADEDDTDETWSHGIETSIGPVSDAPEGIKWIFPQKFRAPDKDYRLSAVKVISHGDAEVAANKYDPKEFVDLKDGYFEFKLYLVKAHFHGARSIPVQLELTWESTEDLAKIKAENDKRMNTYVAEQKRAYEEAYMKAARERITLASKIAPRRYEDLRQEERIAVYRRLLRSLAPGRNPLTDEEILSGKKFTYPDMSDETRHAWSEVLNKLFDLEKMLYFVAPEWWKPHAKRAQTMGAETVVLDAAGNVVKQQASSAIPGRSVVSWGGGKEAGRPNYYITESSAPAKLGSSLGWLLQLDGDSMRNAFLNAPWVKAIVPIRPGREREAKDWLKGVLEGSDGLDPAIEQQLNDLADKVAAKHAKGGTVEDMPDPLNPGDPDATVSSTPVDRVYEFGFDPLEGGFRAQSIEGGEFEIIDQWIEVVPTDQVAAVAVKYDPITGRQIPTV